MIAAQSTPDSTDKSTDKVVIGRAELVSFPDFDIKDVFAKVDTGADLSSLWASDVVEHDGVLTFKLFGEGSDHFIGHEVSVPAPDYLLTRIANSFGHNERRYVVKLKVRIKGRLVRATFSLSNRSNKRYPILIGRKLLNGKFVVDVSTGTTIKPKKPQPIEPEVQEFNNWEMSS